MLARARSLKLTPAARRAAGRSSRLGYIDGARALAALYVVLHHCFQWVWGAPGAHEISVGDWWVVGWLSYGHYAVSAFIAISGFSLMLPIVRANGQLLGGAWAFFKRRARRIIPTYYAAIGITLLLDWLLIGQPSNTPWDATLPITVRTIVSHLMLVQDVDPSGFYTINGVFWSIAIEWHIYFLFPLLVLLARRVGTLAAALSAFVLSLLAFYVIVAHGGPALQHLPAYWVGKLAYLPGRFSQIIDYAGLFALGMLGATVAYSSRHAWPAVRRRVPWMGVALAVVIAIGFLLWFHGRQLGIWGTYGLDILTGLLTLTLFIAASCSTQGIISRLLGWRPLAFTGQYAYSIYLVHAPIVAIVFAYFVAPHLVLPFRLSQIAETAVLIVVVLPIVLVLTYGFFLVFERPFLSKRSPSSRPAQVPTLATPEDAAITASTARVATVVLAPSHDAAGRSQSGDNAIPPHGRNE